MAVGERRLPRIPRGGVYRQHHVSAVGAMLLKEVARLAPEGVDQHNAVRDVRHLLAPVGCPPGTRHAQARRAQIDADHVVLHETRLIQRDVEMPHPGGELARGGPVQRLRAATPEHGDKRKRNCAQQEHFLSHATHYTTPHPSQMSLKSMSNAERKIWDFPTTAFCKVRW